MTVSSSAGARRDLLLQRDLIEKLPALQLRIGAFSQSVVFGRALTYYEQFLDDSANGGHLRSVRQDGLVVTLGDVPEREARTILASKTKLTFRQGAEQRFDRMKEKAHGNSDSEIVERALRFYISLLAEYDSGADLQVVNRNGDVEGIRLQEPEIQSHREPNPPATRRSISGRLDASIA